MTFHENGPIDEHSRFVEIEIVKSNSMKSIIPKLDKVFSSFDISLKVKNDKASTFDCEDFDICAKYLGFIHYRIAPAYPQANGLVENFNSMISNVLHTANVKYKTGKNNFINF